MAITPIFDPQTAARPMRVAAFMSGSGTNIKKLIEQEMVLRESEGKSPFEVVFIFSDRSDGKCAGEKIAMTPSLRESLAVIFGEEAPVIEEPDVTPPDVVEPETPVTGDIAELIERAQAHYEKAQEYVQAGDWAGFGEEWDALQEVLEKLAEIAAE